GPAQPDEPGQDFRSVVNMKPISALARPEIGQLPVYNAGLSSDAVKARYGVDHVARLGSNENPDGPSPAVAQALIDIATECTNYPDASGRELSHAIAGLVNADPACIVLGNGSEN